MVGIIPIILLIMIVVAWMKVWGKINITFSLLSSNKMIVGLVSIYILAGALSVLYLYVWNDEKVTKLSEEALNEVYDQSAALFDLAFEGKFDELDPKAVEQQQSYLIESGKVYLKFNFPEDFSFFVKYVDKPDSNDVHVKVYQSPFVINDIDVTAYKPQLKISETAHDELIFEIEESSISVAEVSSKFPIENGEMNISKGFGSVGGNYLITLEIPKHIKLLNDEEQVIFVP